MSSSTAGERHRHGHHVHSHPARGDHRHLIRWQPSQPLGDAHTHDHEHGHAHDHDHGHSHGLVDRSIVRSRAGVKTVALSFAVLALGAVAQTAIFLLTGSVALLADLIHNFGDALTAVPLAIAFFLRSYRGEKIAGLLVVLAIFVSACVALYETILRFIHPQQLTHLWVLAAAGLIGFAANELAAPSVCAADGACRARPSSPTATTHARTGSSPSA